MNGAERRMRPVIHLPDGAQTRSGLWLPTGYADHTAPDPARLMLHGADVSGLTVVFRRQPDLLDVLFKAIPEEADLGLTTSTLDELRRLIARLPFDTAMLLFARLAAERWHVGADKSRQLALARELLPQGTPVMAAIRRFLAAHDGGAIFAEQQLFALMRLTLAHSHSGAVDETDSGRDSRLLRARVSGSVRRAYRGHEQHQTASRF
jgi:hypothetical protein